jgi:hypothetical protein
MMIAGREVTPLLLSTEDKDLGERVAGGYDNSRIFVVGSIPIPVVEYAPSPVTLDESKGGFVLSVELAATISLATAVDIAVIVVGTQRSFNFLPRIL